MSERGTSNKRKKEPRPSGRSDSHRLLFATSQLVETVSSVLTETNDLSKIMSLAMGYILDTVERRSGAILLLQSLTDPQPTVLAQQRLPEIWSVQISDTESPLRVEVQQTLKDLHTAIQNPEIQLAAAVSFDTRHGQYGILMIQGAVLGVEAIAYLEAVSHILEWSFQANQAYSKVFSTLDTISATVDDSLDTEETEAWVVKRLWQILGTEASSLYLIGKDHENLLFKSTHGSNLEWDYQVILDRADSLVEACIQEKAPIMVNNITAEARFNPKVDAPAGAGRRPIEVRSMLCVPLAAKDQVMGVLQVVNKHSGLFDRYDQGLLTLIATSFGNMIYNTRLIQQLKVANAELETNRWQLLNSRNTLRALFDSIPASIYIIDRKYQLMAVNAARANKISTQPNELVGQLCFQALAGHDSPCPSCRVLETLFDGQSTFRTERRWESADGVDLEEPIEWEISSYPILDEQGEALQAILLEQNVTEKRRLEATLAQSEKLAAVGQLAAGVAHEINNPLTAIIANAQLLQRELATIEDLPERQDVEESLDLILKASARAIQVVSNLLNFARKERYELTPTDINENIRGALSLLQHEIIKRSIDLVFEPNEDLGRISASPNHLQGVWLNLVLNAMDSMEHGKGIIHVSTNKNNNNIQVKVADNGVGIPAERMSRIFEPFYTTKSPGRGTGLGLSVCHRIVKQHGGHILVDSQVDLGTEFTVVLPIT